MNNEVHVGYHRSIRIDLRSLHDDLVLGRTEVQHRLQQRKEQYRRFQEDVNMTASVHSPLVSNDQSSVEVVFLTATLGWLKTYIKQDFNTIYSENSNMEHLKMGQPIHSGQIIYP